MKINRILPLLVQKIDVILKVKRWYHIREQWSKFCDHTTLAGFRLISPTKKNVSSWNRLLLFSIWLTVTILACDLCKDYLTKYLLYDVKTSIRYDAVLQHEFPAITFCNSNSFKRSILGLEDDFLTFLTHILSKSVKDGYERLLEVTKKNIVAEILIVYRNGALRSYTV